MGDKKPKAVKKEGKAKAAKLKKGKKATMDDVKVLLGDETIPLEYVRVRVKISKDVPLDPKQEAVLRIQIENSLNSKYKPEVEDKHLVISGKSVRIKDWSFMDLQPKANSAQPALPGTTEEGGEKDKKKD